MGSPVKPTTTPAAAALFPVTKIQDLGNQEVEVEMLLVFSIFLIHLGNLGFHLCNF